MVTEGCSGSSVRGRQAEQVAAVFMELMGWRVLGRNIRGERGSGVGELDLIVCRKNLVAFVEVKARDHVPDALEALSSRQRCRLERAAEMWMSCHGDVSCQGVRFDVVVVPRSGCPQHVPDAWRPWG